MANKEQERLIKKLKEDLKLDGLIVLGYKNVSEDSMTPIQFVDGNANDIATVLNEFLMQPEMQGVIKSLIRNTLGKQ